MERNQIFQEIDNERKEQDIRHGGIVNDDKNENRDWCRYINKHNEIAASTFGMDFRYAMIRIAALAVAAVEAFERDNNRTN